MTKSRIPTGSQPLPTVALDGSGETPQSGRAAGSTSVIKLESSASVCAPRLSKLKHYELLELIGRGGMGDVYRARDEQTNRIVALKVLSAELTHDELFVRRFEREARALAKLEHPHIVPVYDIDRDQGHVFFAMQYVQGESLDRRVRRIGKPTLNAAIRIMSQCVQALSAAHDQQLIHRDVKPGNVLLQEGTDHVYLVDFGLVRSVDSNTRFTETGLVMGTVDYMSPEQARGSAHIDHRADLYSVGVMLYHLLAGRLPFETPSFQGMLYSHAYENPLPIGEFAPDLPAPLSGLVTRLLAKSPSDRPANCREVLQTLEPLLQLDVRAQQLEAEFQCVAEQRRGLTGERVREIISGQRWRGVQELQSAKDEIDAELSALEQRLEYLQGLKAEGQELCAELRQQAVELDAANANATAVSFCRHAESLVTRLEGVNGELVRMQTLRARLSHCRDGIVKRLGSAAAKSRQRIPLSLWLAPAALVLLVLTTGTVIWFSRNIPITAPPNVSETAHAAPAGDQQPSKPAGRIVAGESLNLLPLTKLPDDVVMGSWLRDESGAVVGSSAVGPISGHARLQLPARPAGDYKVKVRFSRLHTGDANVVFPVGRTSVRATFGQWPEGGLVARGDGRNIIGRGAIPPTSDGGSVHEAHIVVRSLESQKEVKIYVNRILTCDWRGDGEDLEVNSPCAIPDQRAIGLTTYGAKGTRFHSVVLEMLTGHADLTRSMQVPPAGSASAEDFLERARDEWARGDLAAARRNYEELLRVVPDEHYRRGELAAICLGMRDETAYRHHCQLLVARLKEVRAPDHRLHTLRIALLADGAADGWSQADQQQVFADERDSEWKDRVAILWHYRHGRWQQAMEGADRYLGLHQAWRERAQCLMLRSLALWKAGQQKQATDELQAAEQYIASQSSTSTKWTEAANLLYLQIYFREATALIRGKAAELSFQAKTAPATPTTYLEGPLDVLTAAVEARPQEPDGWIRRGRWHLVRQNWKEARADYVEYLQLKPDNMWVRREYLNICLALEERDPRPYATIVEYVRSMPQGKWAFDDLRSLCLISEPRVSTPSNLVKWSARSGQPTGWKKMYLIPITYRAGDYDNCAAEAAAQFPNGPQQQFQAFPCLCEAAALKQLGKDEDARRKLTVVRDFIEQGKTSLYPNPREELILNLTFDTLHAQIFYREASELILGQRDELKAPTALDLVQRQTLAK